jgi:hypothetical protein
LLVAVVQKVESKSLTGLSECGDAVTGSGQDGSLRRQLRFEHVTNSIEDAAVTPRYDELRERGECEGVEGNLCFPRPTAMQLHARCFDVT